MVTRREVAGDPELAALQRVMESDEDYFLRVTGHPPGPADAQSTLMFVPEGRSPRTRRPSACGPTASWSASSTCCCATRTTRPCTSGRLLIDRGRQGQGIGTAAYQALEREVLPRWPWVRRLRLSVVRTNDQVLGFWRRMGFTETGEVRPVA